MKRSAVLRLMLTCFVLYAATPCLCSQSGNSSSGDLKKSMRILIIGDSNTEIGNITMPLKAMIDSKYGNSGTGYCTLNPSSMGRVPDSLSVNCDTNWIRFDMRDGWVPEPGPYFAPDGLSISSERPGATVTVRFNGTGIDLYYLQDQEGGRFNVSIDGRKKVTVNTKVSPASTGKVQYCNLSSGWHSMTVKVNTGRVTLFGVDARRADVKDDTRFVLHKWGNGWASTAEYTGIDRNVFITGLKKLNPDKVVILLGTNDHGLDRRDALTVRDNLKEIITRIHEALPSSGVIVVSTFATSDSEIQGILPGYVTTSFPGAAREAQASYWDMSTWFGPYDPAKLEDGVHVTETYGRTIASMLFDLARSGGLICTESDSYRLTHLLTPAGPVPTAFDPNGVYPYMSYSETSNRPVPEQYHFIALENDRIKVTICPDLGGKITSMIHKESGKEVLYVPEVLRQTRILPRFYFTAGGIEVSFPISHTPVQNEKVLYKIDRTDDRTYVTCGERELRFGMQWSVEYSLGPDDNFVTERVLLHNPGTSSYPWMSWSNAAVPSAPDTRFDFPGGQVLVHSSTIDTIDWRKEGLATESDIREMTGYFWDNPDAGVFGVFTPSAGIGLYHAARSDAPGVKLWSYGTGADSTWSTLSTASHSPYIEIQGGPISTQAIKLTMNPDEYKHHVEYWIPADKDLDIYSHPVPSVRLRPVDSLPLFGWARNQEVDAWLGLLKAYNTKEPVPDVPGVTQYCWPPSGMEDLGPAFQWAIENNLKGDDDTWRFYYGAWAAGRSDTATAIATLSRSTLGLSKALLGRLLKLSGDTQGALNAYNSIREGWLQIHPQVVIERDKLLRALGNQMLNEREYWLSRVNALDDEWLIERRVQLLIDQGKPSEAKDLLLATHFQKIHQTYTRTGLWFQICDMLNEPHYPIPAQLGEDRLAHFGAYREFE